MKQLDKMILWNDKRNILISYTIKWDIGDLYYRKYSKEFIGLEQNKGTCMYFLKISEDPKFFGTIVPKNVASKVDATIFFKLKCWKQKTIM